MQADIAHLKQETKVNFTELHASLHEINSTLSNDVTQTKLVFENDLKNKVPKESFTKLVNESKYAVNKLSVTVSEEQLITIQFTNY